MSCALNGCSRMPTVFISHGGGPCFQMPDEEGIWTNLRSYLESIQKKLPNPPKAIVMISGHWDEREVSVNANYAPDLLYDYYGFPDYTYQLSYPAPGHPELASRVQSMLQSEQIPARLEHRRGYDHGVFVPMMVAFPEAKIPMVQVSLHASLDPALHYKMGEALAPLRDEGILIIGSGFTYHNLRNFFSEGGNVKHEAQTFDDWLSAATTKEDVTERKRLLTSELPMAPFLRQCHPRTEHLIPLLVAAGAAGEDRGVKVLDDLLMGKIRHSAYWFGDMKGDERI